MMNHAPIARRALLLLALLPAACETVAGPPPVFTLDDRRCHSEPRLDDAVDVGATGDPVSINLDATAACLQNADGKRSTYVVFRLPEAAEPYILGVKSTPWGYALLPPRLTLLDAERAVSRERPHDAFMFQGSSLYTGLRARPEERYLIVASEPRMTGQNVSQIASQTHAHMVSTGAAFFVMHTGSEANRTFYYSHNGTVIITVKPLPKAD
jgi:hypothetical protein